MTRWIPAIAPGVVFENVGDQTLVLVGNPPQVVRLSPEAAELLAVIQHNPGNEIEQTPALSQLVDLGVVEDTSPSTLSRRNVLQLSAVAGAVGLSTVLLPQAAMASSSESSSFYAMGTYEYVDGSDEWRFRLEKADFPGEDKYTEETGNLKLGDLEIEGATIDDFTAQSPTRTVWFDKVSGSDTFTGVVEGTLKGFSDKEYTVGFTAGAVT